MNEHGKFIRTIDLNQIEKYATPELINHCLLDLDQGITLVLDHTNTALTKSQTHTASFALERNTTLNIG